MTFDDQLKRAVDTLGDRLRDDISRELRLLAYDLSVSAKTDREIAANEAAQQPTEALKTAAETAGAAGATQGAPADDARLSTANRFDNLLRAVRAIDHGRSLSEILESLVTSAGQEAGRAAVLLVRGGRVRGWRFIGFPPSFDGSHVDLALDDAGIIAGAVERQGTASNVADGPAPSFAELAEHPGETEAIAIPVALAGEVVAVLYADQANPESGTRTLEPAILEVMARHAARALEALTALRAAASMMRADAGSAAMDNKGSRRPISDDEDEAARRYARLVISEIKLYHEDAVAEGRRDRNLTTRLGGEIARARALYEERVPAHLRGAAEHFHAELVRTLAGGDATLFAKASPW
jgi:GAF domain-containing protein